MTPVVIDVGGHGAPMMFAHANGYPPKSYRQLSEALLAHFTLSAIEHRPLWIGREPPGRLRWDLFTDDLLEAMDRRYANPVWVMGHSMGGTIATLAAAREPQRFAGLILLDPVFLPDRFIFGMRLIPKKKLRQMPMIRRALSRPEAFDDKDAAFEFYRAKHAFRGLSDSALRDYVDASKTPRPEGGVELRYSRAWEAAVYGSAPRVRSALKKLGRIPTLGLRGRDSDTLRPEVWARWPHWQPTATLREIPGGHLFPLEHPNETAEAVVNFAACGDGVAESSHDL